MGRVRASILLLLSLAFVALGAFIATTGDAEARLNGAGCAVFFGGCAIVAAGELLPRRRPAPDSAGVLIIRPAVTNTVILMIGGAMFAVGGALIGADAGGKGDAVMKWVGWLGGGFFALAVPAGLIRLVQAKALYRLDPDGVTHLVGGGWRLAWREIRDIQVFSVSDQSWLALEPIDAAAPRRGVVETMNAMAGFPAFAIGAQGTGMAFDELSPLVFDYWARGRGW